jgi:hypothetical protein
MRPPMRRGAPQGIRGDEIARGRGSVPANTEQMSQSIALQVELGVLTRRFGFSKQKFRIK